MSALASVLESRAEELLVRWVDRLRDGIAPDGKTELELRDHVPMLLRELAQAIRTGRVPQRTGAAEEHGRQRYRLGFEIEALVREYGALRNVLFDVVEEQGVAVSLPEVRALTDFISTAIAEGVTEHNEQQRAHERKKELAQAEAHRQAERTLRHQAEFEQQLIGIVSHDLRNPLNVISLSSTLLKRDETLTPRSLQFVVRIQNATERAIRMVDDLLDFTQARLGGGLQVRLKPGDVHAIVGAVVDEVAAAYPERALTVAHDGDGLGVWDPDRLAQVVQNLVTNALKYSPPSTPVSIATRPSGDGVCLVVHNDGAPIAPEKLAVLFEPYQRAVSHTDKLDRSIGLGLYIVKKIIDAHGGSIAVQSTEAGTTFTVTLPRK